ncbi:DNA modification methylase [Candidatus Gracilibacteria bacterium]|nr:DNA modification methylase [Candidatus Gracilibacteria bacterium]
MTKQNLTIIQVPISELNTGEYNPRRHTKKQFSDLKESIKKFGFVDPIIANSNEVRKNIVIGGTFRLEVAKELGFIEIPVVYVNISDIKKEKELNLRLNKNTGEWDLDILKDFDVDLLLDVGFDNQDLSEIWDNILDIEDDNFNVEKELKKIKTPKSKLGDIYELGNHRLICGDSTDSKVVKNLMGENKTNYIYSDPPYNIGLNYSSGISSNNKYGGSFKEDKKSEKDYRGFIDSTIKNILNHANTDTHLFYWCDENYIGTLQELYKQNKIEHKRVCLWIKNNQNMTPNLAFNKVYEPCVYGIIGKPFINKDYKNLNEIQNKEIGTGNKCHDDIFDLFNIWLEKREDVNSYEHPTQKPPTLHEKALKRCTKLGDIVVDLFGGSGSTLIACEQLKRKAYLIEIDPIFVDLIIKRYEEFSGKKAKKLNKFIY